MIYELKRYAPHPGKSDAMRALFLTHAAPILYRLGFRLMSVYSPRDEQGELWVFFAFKDAAQQSIAWLNFESDPQWVSAKLQFEMNGALWSNERTTTLEKVELPSQWMMAFLPPGLL